jgi:two-component system OmpR family sensor kinase
MQRRSHDAKLGLDGSRILSSQSRPHLRSTEASMRDPAPCLRTERDAMNGRSRGTLVWRLYLIGFVQMVVLAAAMGGVGWVLGRQGPPARICAAPSPGEPPGSCVPSGALMEPPPLAPPLLTFFFGGLAIVGVGSLMTARVIVRPLETLSRAARALGSGDLRARAGLVRRDELGDLGRAFDDMAGRIEELLLSERELLANVSHELRTPLARLRVALELADEADGDAGRASLREMGHDLAEIETLIDDILTTARLVLQAGRGPASGFSLHPVLITPAALCRAATDRFARRHPVRPLDTAVGEGTPAVNVDPVLFRRVIENLLENADKYTPEGRARITLRAYASEDRVFFEVNDRGLGIPEEDVERVFEPFFRGERSRSRSGGGVGLGLTLAKRIVEAHGGCIEVVSAVAEGTTVRVSLPTGESARKE